MSKPASKPKTSMSVDEYNAMQANKPRGNKYRVAPAAERIFDGTWHGRRQYILFDSKGELQRFLELIDLEATNQIRRLERQPRFVIREAELLNGVSFPPEFYVGDFYYLKRGEDGVYRPVCEDYKGQRLRAYLHKIALARAKYPEVEFKEVAHADLGMKTQTVDHYMQDSSEWYVKTEEDL